MTTRKLSELVQIIIEEFIEYPQLLTIQETEEEVEDEPTIIIKVHSTSKSDTGKVIGKL
jgi:predicted RNA-binding protein YlqC (UPF0109 family)